MAQVNRGWAKRIGKRLATLGIAKFSATEIGKIRSSCNLPGRQIGFQELENRLLAEFPKVNKSLAKKNSYVFVFPYICTVLNCNLLST